MKNKDIQKNSCYGEIKLAFYPISSTTNTYIDVIINGLSSKGIITASFKNIFTDFSKFREIRLVHLNWYENISKNAFSDFTIKAIKLILLFIAGKKIIWTMHNKKPHDGKYRFLSGIIMRMIARFSSAIIIHSVSSREILAGYYGQDIKKKIVYIPHPNYINVYGSQQPQLFHKTNSIQLKILFLGSVQPYKNLELLIDVVRQFDISELTLTIAGKPFSKKYAQDISFRSESVKNIKLDFRFIEDSELPLLIGESDLLVLPYDLTSSLNSGTVLLAFSYGKTVICPAIGTISDYLSNSSSNILSYTYINPKEHFLQLSKTITNAINKKKQDPFCFEKMGNSMLSEVREKNDNLLIVGQFLEVYKKLVA